MVAQSPTLTWDQRYPDLLPDAGASEYSVGAATTSSHLYTAGMAKRTGVYQFCLAKHDFATGAIVAEHYWPPTTQNDPDVRTVVGMVSFTSTTSDVGEFWIAGHQPDFHGSDRTSLVKFQTTGVPQFPLNVAWGLIEDSEGSRIHERPVGVALSLTPPAPAPAPDVLAVAANTLDSLGVTGVMVRRYLPVNGKLAWAVPWKSTATSTDHAVGVSIGSDAVIVAGTTNAHPTLSGNHKRLFVLALEKETGDHLPGSPLYFEPLTGQEFDAVAQATAMIESQGTQSFTAVAATRTTLSTGNQAATVHTCAITESPRALVGRWSDGWDGSLPLTDPTPINRATSVHVAGFTPTDQITANFRVWLGGTVQTNSEAATGLLVVQFDDQPDPNPRREWWDIWRRNVLGANNVPLAIRFSENNSESKRIYVVGKTQNAGGDYDMVTIKYDTAAEIGGGNKPPLWGDNGNPILNNISAFGDDVGVAVHPRPNMQGDPMNFFITGPSFGGSTANDWLTARYQESP